MADLLALGVTMAIGACGGPQIPLRGGRIDATGPGASGVPEPETDVKTTLAEFSGAGFNQADSIGLTACGHTMGGVHHSTFPQIVPESAVGVNNAGGRIAFDDTVANFDVDAVRQYVSGSGNRGGPLVTTANKTVRSDLRLFSSDRNATVKKLAQSTDQFRSTCAALFARMVDTVPTGVTLTSVIDPAQIKSANVTLNVDWSGKLRLSGFLRYIETASSTSAPASLTLVVIDRSGRISRATTKAMTDHVDNSNGIYGPTFHYPFTISFPGTTGLSGIDVDGERLPLQDSLFVVPNLSSISPGLATYNILDPAHEFTFNITAAVSISIGAAVLMLDFSNSLTYPATNRQASSLPERNNCTSGIPGREHESEDGFLNHGGIQLHRHGWSFCFVLGHPSPEHDIAAAFWEQHRH